ncbi:GNAT family N-acetyltransferase [uncultured Amnibacterium sp.]|uniref:GNAT family N-acetyltransferase n=1 Tax=uncultured Amnibacterium sp. TaxID=1631851 RepID=UPI0035C96ADE
MTAQAVLAPHSSWTDGPVRWAWSADGRSLHGVFPQETPPDVVRRAVEAADALGAVEVSVWSEVDVARPELERLGFQVGWQPCWMVAPASGFDAAPVRLSGRARLSVRAGAREARLQPLLSRDDTWRGEARQGGRSAGRAWLHLSGDVAGLYDMGVRPRFRRSGLGRDLVTLLGATVFEHRAERITLNATPDGEHLYRACGFTGVGVGRTWWRLLRDHRTGERL